MRNMFASKLLTDASLFYLIDQIMSKGSEKDAYLVVCGIENMAYGFGVPERLWLQYGQELKEKTYMICSHDSGGALTLSKAD